MHTSLPDLAIILAAGSGLVSAQGDDSDLTTVTAYVLFNNQRLPTTVLPSIETSAWTGAVLSAGPSATTYHLSHSPLPSNAFGVQSDITLVNGPSTYAAWQVYNGSSTYGEFCSVITPASDTTSAAHSDPTITDAPVATTIIDALLDCRVTYLGARTNGTGDARSSFTFLETAVNTYAIPGNRTWRAIPAVLTGGAEELEGSQPTVPPGEGVDAAGATETGEGGGGAEATARTRTGGADGQAGTGAASATGEEGAVETLAEEGGVRGRKEGVSLLLLAAAGLVGAGAVVC